MKIRDFIYEYGALEASDIISNNSILDIINLDFSKKSLKDYYKNNSVYLTICIISHRNTYFDKDGTYCEAPGFSTGSFVDSKIRKSNKKDIIYIQLYDEFYELINTIINIFENESDFDLIKTIE